MNPYIISTLSVALLPLVLGLASFLFWRIIAFTRPNTLRKTWARNAMTTCFVFSYLNYPSITNSVF